MKEKIIENLSKWDKDIFEIASIVFDRLDENIFVPVSAINEARRELAEKLTDSMLVTKAFNASAMPQLVKYDSPLGSIVIVDERMDIGRNYDAYSSIVLSPTVYSIAIVSEFYSKFKSVLGGRLVINLPIVAMADDLVIIDEIVDWAIANDIGIMINNIYGLDYLSKGAKVIAGSNMNIANGYAMASMKAMGIEDIVFSCEKWTDRSQGSYKMGSGRRVLMTMAHCPAVTLSGQGCVNIKGDCGSGCQYKGQMSLRNDNNTYGIRRYRIKNCYFELLDEFREDTATTAVVVDLRK